MSDREIRELTRIRNLLVNSWKHEWTTGDLEIWVEYAKTMREASVSAVQRIDALMEEDEIEKENILDKNTK